MLDPELEDWQETTDAQLLFEMLTEQKFTKVFLVRVQIVETFIYIV